MGWVETFWSKVEIKESHECWVWKGCTHKIRGGYGVFRTTAIEGKDKLYKAHRLAFRLSYGFIDDSLGVLHKCDNPPCCNPNHLYQGTDADNVRDMVERGRHRSNVPFPHPRAKLTIEQVKEIFLSKDNNVVLAKKYGLCRAAIRNIKLGRTWSAITKNVL